MRTRRPVAALVLTAALAAAACGGSPSNVASHSPTPASQPPSAQASASAPASPSSTATPSPTSLPALNGSFGVLVSPVTGSGSYSLAIVGVDGRVVASAQASSPAAVSCNNTAAAVVPLPVSTSDHRLYFMDAAGEVRTLAPDGTVSGSPVINLPAGTASRRSMFAVSPDDALIAVVVDDFTSSGATTNLYIDQLQAGGTQKLIYSQSGSYSLWPIGWHGSNNLVVAKVPSCRQGVGIGGSGIIEYHVVDPATGTRRFTVGGSSCLDVSNPSPSGAICENPPSASILSWTDTTLRTYPIQGPVGAYLSPDGNNVAFVDNVGTTFTNGGSAMAGVFTCAWIDNSHVLAGGDAQQQPRIGDITNGTVVPVAAQGDCGGRLPGGL